MLMMLLGAVAGAVSYAIGRRVWGMHEDLRKARQRIAAYEARDRMVEEMRRMMGRGA